MRNIALSCVDHIARPVLAMSTDYPVGTLLATHHHRRAQFLYGATGLMEVVTDDGAWIVPPESGVWIPAGKPHQVKMMAVRTCSLYIASIAAPRQSAQCEVLHVTPLLRQLLLEAVDIPAEYALSGRDDWLMQLALAEVGRASTLPYFVPMPSDPRLLTLCTDFLHAPSVHASPLAWAAALHKSDRTFSRFFREQTGMAFSQWRQQACLMAALSLLSKGVSVTAVAMTLGYDNPGAFSTMFRKQLGYAPSNLLHQHNALPT